MTEASEFRSVLLSPNEVLKFWSQIEPDITKALEHSVNELTAFDVCKQALDGRIHVWLIIDNEHRIVCTTTTRYLNYPSHKALQIITCTASSRRWEEFYQHHQAIEDFAKQSGCSSIQVWGRKGWQRQLKKLISKAGTQYKTQYYVFNMEI